VGESKICSSIGSGEINLPISFIGQPGMTVVRQFYLLPETVKNLVQLFWRF
jgi:hypothetical protein